MSIKIQSIKEADMRRLTMLIWGEAKIGKTSLVKTLPVTDESKVLYVGADPGQLVLRDHTYSMARPNDGVWSMVYFTELADWLRVNGGRFEFIVIDSIDEVGELVLHDLLARGTDGRQAYGRMADFMASEFMEIDQVITNISF